ncbi:putative epithelial chloride channel protein-like [Apostichopus japonicus]|uniref:Putative epithelial chloride channel protein-like n=1 Tax=Stichopus japonicus TaxID=307972 RepID=A0A2G8LK03_STIJA|nr:putative epithelial chloride channel protein-like [Apostichopus japonicus]
MTYFKEVRILIHLHAVNNPSYVSAVSESFENSDVRIDNPGEDSSFPNINRPYTAKPTFCGSQGLYIHLTPEFVTDGDIANVYGGYDKVLAHEWAHYRWGVFDEYPQPGEQHFYDSSSGQVEAVRCTKSITASLMYKQFLDYISEFCDEDEDGNGNERLIHNAEAPNRQNRHCEMKSVWQVMKEHSDFVTSQGTVNIQRTEFVIVRQRPARYVIVIDNSASMFARLLPLRQAIYIFINEVLVDGEELGLVNFNDNGMVISNLTTVNDNTRTTLFMDLPTQAEGATTIGGGVEKGLDVLNTTGDINTLGGRLIVLTDGEENKDPRISDIINTTGSVLIHTIAIGDKVDQNLESLATRTGGRQFLHQDSSTALFDIFSQFGVDVRGASAEELVSEYIANFTMAEGLRRITFVRDNTLRGGITIYVGVVRGQGFGLGSEDLFEVRLESPSGLVSQSRFEVFASLFIVDTNSQEKYKTLICFRNWLTGYNPVIVPEVEATVETPNGLKKMKLYDDGIGEDIVQGEGQIVNGARVGVGAAVDPEKGQAEWNVTYEPSGDVQRTITGGVLLVTMLDLYGNNYGPYRLIPSSEGFFEENRTLELTFTAPGANLMDGRARSYDIRYSTSFEDFRSTFASGVTLGTAENDEKPYILSGNPNNPSMARNEEIYTIMFPLRSGRRKRKRRIRSKLLQTTNIFWVPQSWRVILFTGMRIVIGTTTKRMKLEEVAWLILEATLAQKTAERVTMEKMIIEELTVQIYRMVETLRFTMIPFGMLSERPKQKEDMILLEKQKECLFQNGGFDHDIPANVRGQAYDDGVRNAERQTNYNFLPGNPHALRNNVREAELYQTGGDYNFLAVDSRQSDVLSHAQCVRNLSDYQFLPAEAQQYGDLRMANIEYANSNKNGERIRSTANLLEPSPQQGVGTIEFKKGVFTMWCYLCPNPKDVLSAMLRCNGRGTRRHVSIVIVRASIQLGKVVVKIILSDQQNISN